MQKIWIWLCLPFYLILFMVSLKFRLLCGMISRHLMTWSWLPSPACLYLLLPLISPAMGHLVFYPWDTAPGCLDVSHLCAFARSIVFTLECPSFSWWSFKAISKYPVAPWLPNKSFSANSVPHIVDFLYLLYCGIITYGSFCTVV